MPSLLFYLFAAITLGFGLNVVLARNPVTSALSLAACFTGLAALFISLDAYLIGVLQILVYAGAVMVLFLFIIMLLDIKKEEGKKPNPAAVLGGILLAALMMLQISAVLSAFSGGQRPLADSPLKPLVAAEKATLPTIRRDLEAGSLPDAKLMGLTLFDRYGFHLQAMGLLLLVGTVGVVVLSKREKASNP